MEREHCWNKHGCFYVRSTAHFSSNWFTKFSVPFRMSLWRTTNYRIKLRCKPQTIILFLNWLSLSYTTHWKTWFRRNDWLVDWVSAQAWFVKCFRTVLKTSFKGSVLLKKRQLFSIVYTAVFFIQRIRENERMPSFAKKRILGTFQETPNFNSRKKLLKRQSRRNCSNVWTY